MPRIHANGIDLYYEERGEGVPILCIHGTSSSALVWEEDAREIARHGHCITYDRRGCYRSERPEPYYTTDVVEHTDDAAALLDELGATPAVVVGRSYGGEIALDLALRYPDRVRALALLEPAMLELAPEAVAWVKPVMDRALAAGERDVASVAETFLGDVAGPEAWESFPEKIKQMFVGNGPAILAELRGRMLDVTPEQFAAIEHPALLVSAKESPEAFRRVDALIAEALPNCETTLIEGNHLISPAHPEVLKFVDRFATVAAPRR